MSDQFLDEFCKKLEAAIDESASQSTAAEQSVDARFVKVTEQLENLAEEVSTHRRAAASLRHVLAKELESLRKAYAQNQAGASERQRRIEHLEIELASQAEAVQAGRRRVGELANLVEQRNDEIQRARNRVQDLENELAAVRTDQEALQEKQRGASAAKEALAADLEDTREELIQVREELEGLRASAEKVGAAERLLEAERLRANELEERLKMETSSGTRAVIAQQLADAFRELEASRIEVSSLRTEIESLRKAAAVKPEPDRLLEAERVTTPKKSRPERDLPKRQMDEILLEAGVITQQQLDEALAAQMEDPQQSLAEILVGQGAATEEEVAQAMATQHRVLYVRLNENTIDRAAASLISARIAQHHHCIPVRATEEALVLAMVDPLNLIAIEDVERASNRSVRPVMATQSDIAAAIDRIYEEAGEQAF